MVWTPPGAGEGSSKYSSESARLFRLSSSARRAALECFNNLASGVRPDRWVEYREIDSGRPELSKSFLAAIDWTEQAERVQKSITKCVLTSTLLHLVRLLGEAA